jgi:hypothetical protein
MSPSTRALLAAAREGLGPDPAAATRVRAKLDAAIAGATPGAAGSGLAIKLAAAVGVAAAVVAAIPRHSVVPTAAATAALDDSVSIEAPAPSVHAAVHEPAAPAAPPASPQSPASRGSRAAGELAMPEVNLAREVELVDDAMAALRANQLTEALAAVAMFHRETGDRGQLVEDATAIEIEASCKLHIDVRAKLAAFDETWPTSAQRARLTAACQ